MSAIQLDFAFVVMNVLQQELTSGIQPVVALVKKMYVKAKKPG